MCVGSAVAVAAGGPSFVFLGVMFAAGVVERKLILNGFYVERGRVALIMEDSSLWKARLIRRVNNGARGILISM